MEPIKNLPLKPTTKRLHGKLRPARFANHVFVIGAMLLATGVLIREPLGGLSSSNVLVPLDRLRYLDPRLAEVSPQTIEMLHDKYHVPYLFLDAISDAMIKRMTHYCLEREARNTTPTFLFVHPRNGLGNRMRVLGSALSYAKHHGNRILVVIWDRDVHMQADLFDLFEDENNVVLAENLKENWPMVDAQMMDPDPWSFMDIYNYMETELGSEKGKTVVENQDRNIYFRGCEIMSTPNVENMRRASSREIRKLRPVRDVREKLDELESISGPFKELIGVHIRQMSVRQEFSAEFDAMSEYGETSLERMETGRAMSSVASFEDEMRRLLTGKPDLKFYVAADSVSVLQRLDEGFPDRIYHIPVADAELCENSRELFCTKVALVDIFALSQTNHLLGSSMSSFTLTASKMGSMRVKIAGEHFGKAA